MARSPPHRLTDPCRSAPLPVYVLCSRWRRELDTTERCAINCRLQGCCPSAPRGCLNVGAPFGTLATLRCLRPVPLPPALPVPVQVIPTPHPHRCHPPHVPRPAPPPSTPPLPPPPPPPPSPPSASTMLVGLHRDNAAGNGPVLRHLSVAVAVAVAAAPAVGVRITDRSSAEANGQPLL